MNPKADEILGRKAYKSVTDVPGEVDVAVFAIPAKFVRRGAGGGGREGHPQRRADPLRLRRDRRARTPGRDRGDRRASTASGCSGPNIYGYYSTWQDLCATFCTPYDVKGGVALTSQSGGIGMAILGFARTTKTGVSAIVGLGNKSDLDEDDLLTWFGEDPQHRVHRDAPGGPQGRPRLRRGGARDVSEEAGRRAQGGPYQRRAPRRRARTPARSPATTRSTTTS